jgi:hypothetical protein
MEAMAFRLPCDAEVVWLLGGDHQDCSAEFIPAMVLPAGSREITMLKST